MRTFITDFKRDTMSGGAMTIDGREVVPRTTLDQVRSLGGTGEGVRNGPEGASPASRHPGSADAVAYDAVAEITAAVPPDILDTVIGAVTQRAPLELNARFAVSTLGVATAIIEPSHSGVANFAIETPASHGRPGVVVVQASKMCSIKGLASSEGRITAFDTPQDVTLSGTFEITAEGITVTAASAHVHPQGRS